MAQRNNKSANKEAFCLREYKNPGIIKTENSKFTFGGDKDMPNVVQNLIEQYVVNIKKIYGSHLRQIILFGSYARGDFGPDSDIDIMILLDMSDLELKVYSQELSYMTYDFNLDNGIDIKPIAKSEDHFRKWIVNYPFYANIDQEGVILYGAA